MAVDRFLEVARGDAAADLVLRNGWVVNCFTRELLKVDVAVVDGVIGGVGAGYVGREEIDLGGRPIGPGLIDAHVHIESSMVTPYEYARAVVPRGVTTVIADPHEIANVAGRAGVEYMLGASDGLPLSVLLNLPSCVPATHMATAGATLTADDLVSLADAARVLGLAEMMNVPGVVLGSPGPLAKLKAFRGQVIDGHAPGLGGQWLQAYVGAGPGSDHESTSVPEMVEKLRAGMFIFIREATAARNLEALIRGVTPAMSRRCAFCTDDRHPADLLDEGSIDHALRLAVRAGCDPLIAMQMATLNAAEWFGLRDRGAVMAGRRADLVVWSGLDAPRAEMVFSAGRLVAQEGEPQDTWQAPSVDDAAVRDTMHVDLQHADLALRAPSGVDGVEVRMIGIVPEQVVTEALSACVPVVTGRLEADPSVDRLKLAVIERHRASGRIGLGFVQGLGLQRGALAGSVGHDAHNLTVAGCDDRSMLTAARAVEALGGGLVAAVGDEVLAAVPLPIAGLMSDAPIDLVRQRMDRLLAASHDLGATLDDPFMSLGFLALEVIPQLRLTDRGLVDVEAFDFVPLLLTESGESSNRHG